MRNLTLAHRKKLTSQFSHKGLIENNSFDNFVEGLYKYRCSIVHSKESEIQNTEIPDPFDDISPAKYWNYAMQNIAKRIISRMCIAVDMD
jgi:hypothetical protein